MDEEGGVSTDDEAPPTYCVTRPAFNEHRLQDELLHRRQRVETSIKHRLAQRLRCTSQRARGVAVRLLPILSWLPSYPLRSFLFYDVMSGLSTGVVQLPQGLAYAMLAAVPAVYGLYSSFYPVLLYTFFGTSRHISVGTFAVMSLMIGGVVVREAPDSMFPIPAANGSNVSTVDLGARDAQRVQVAVALTTLVGLIQLLLGALRLGFVAIYLTEPLVRGFTTAAAIQVCVSQLKYLFGVRTPRYSGVLATVYTLVAVVQDLGSTNVATVTMGVACIMFLYGMKQLNERCKARLPLPLPGEIIVVIVATATSYGMGLADRYQVDVVGVIPKGLLPPALPQFHLFPRIATDAFAVAIVGFSMAISMAKTFALKHGYHVDGNQELLALGLCNFVSSFFQTFAISCSMSRSLVQESTGGKTQIAGLLASLLVLLVIVAIGFLFEALPQTVLAAVIMVNLLGMFKQILDIPLLWRRSRLELGIWLVSFVASLLLGLDYGLLVAVAFAILTVIYRTQSPSSGVLGQVPGTGLYYDVDLYEGLEEYSGIKIFQSNSSVYFANCDLYVTSLRDKSQGEPTTKQSFQDQDRDQDQKTEAEKDLSDPSGPPSATAPGVTGELLSWCKEGGVSSRPAGGRDVHTLILDWSPVNFVDTVGSKAITSMIKEFAAKDVRVFIAGCNRPLLSQLETLQFFSGVVTRDILFPTVHDAVLYSQHQEACASQSQPIAITNGSSSR
ncbi:prestin isoform X4 [Gadus macrocephalus]|uniref:prestin isoform X4 n=1 Tax=Gadus macrocephalus TaxID=80720 RepID=UPI0028CBBC94|nr:prestin isoform X4 [Gadus macrocephalus]